MAYDARVKHRTTAYWPTRIALAAGFLATVAAVLHAGALLMGPCFGCDRMAVLGLPSNAVEAALSVGLAVVGLVWMLRIFFQGRRDDPPAWRYRDR